MKKGVGDQFQEETKYLRNKIEGVVWSKPPDLYKIYPDSKKILLPEPMFSIEKTLDEVLKKRKSIRSFSNIPVSKKNSYHICYGLQQGYRGKNSATSSALPLQQVLSTLLKHI